jgi:Tfp pilus assembly protein PilE
MENKKTKNSTKTIAVILLVVVVVPILLLGGGLVIALPQYYKAVERSKVKEDLAVLGSLSESVKRYKSLNYNCAGATLNDLDESFQREDLKLSIDTKTCSVSVTKLINGMPTGYKITRTIDGNLTCEEGQYWDETICRMVTN